MSPSPSPPLPTPRQLLTSILNAISRIPAPEEQQQQQQQQARGPETTTASRVVNPVQAGAEAPQLATTATAATNPLRLVDPAHRPLLTTLHVLFPSLLLPALDLLDRGLVTRLGLLLPPGERERERDVGDGGGDGTENPTRRSPPSSPVYLVRSAQKPTRRPYGAGGDPTAAAAQRTYVVQAAAWNCTCAAFAFSAFPPPPPAGIGGRGRGRGSGRDVDVDDDGGPFGLRAAEAGEEGEGEGGVGGHGEDGRGDMGRRPAAAWQFGGMSYDGLGEGGEAVPPCCKHLLACVLAERWGAMLGRYVTHRTVGREEIAGIFADI